uniref:Ig-like domain-containing protein n=1 Tax=Anas platyrhynchos TaxID=8839 RepID=A0A8B9ZED0_ANAPL
MGLPWGCGQPSLTSHVRGLLTSLITLLLLRLGSAQLTVVGPGHSVTATVGKDVVLPCHLSPQCDARSLDVRWMRDEFSETVHHYRNGEDLYGEQMGTYAGRTELVRDGLSAGSLDLRITGLRPSDDGLYICNVKNADGYAEAIVELEVSATGADPHLSLGGYEAGGVRVLCRSAGWYPLPQLLWRNARGQHLPSDPPTHSQDQEGLFQIEGAVIVTGSVEGPLSCVVSNSRLQHERESSLHISGTNGTARVRCSLTLHSSREKSGSCPSPSGHEKTALFLVPFLSSLLPQRPALDGGSGSGPRAIGCVHWPRCLSLSKASGTEPRAGRVLAVPVPSPWGSGVCTRGPGLGGLCGLVRWWLGGAGGAAGAWGGSGECWGWGCPGHGTRPGWLKGTGIKVGMGSELRGCPALH